MVPGDIDDLVRRFQAQAISREHWTHLAHLRVGAWHVHHFGVDAALDRLRDGIRQLNERNGVVNSTRSGYHETITRAYVLLLDEYLRGAADAGAVYERIDGIAADPIADRNLLFRYYSRHRLLSPDARGAWVEPDLRPLRLADTEP